MTTDQLDNLSALHRRIRHAEAITCLAAENKNGLDDANEAVAGVSLLLIYAGQQLDELIVDVSKRRPDAPLVYGRRGIPSSV